MYINTFHYTREDVDCKYCTEYRTGEGCTANGCPWLAERIEAGAVGYQEAVMKTFPHNRRLNPRLRKAVRYFPGSLYLTAAHRKRMEDLKARLGYRRKRDTSAYFAVMYLLTANEDIADRTSDCFCKNGIMLHYAVTKDITPHNYALLGAAKDIYTDSSGIILGDLASSEIVDNLAFGLIVNALLIARYGCAVLKIEEKEAPH